ncbi:MAG: DUF3298 and DUF4163 domain-containing protein [Cellulophaga sp.]|uniref:DUF3298 and DUF4163 domain-containing protein n=1 Tax=unclassified Cellulophaga TaxID=2634405 RepID=UPI0026E446CD|nr:MULTISPECIES: DUF3298 and DUF4163 domain-containing protein [unclassified Cellulophaga]MDO6491107.1 DUF3298 and DUF4163 domain-containing protein [Cellulophaga sp. 2_MG-2023]MDO6495360.1 DUF3298 and DUF4163 domain-containing protein [Cellulophaga sp. 3_MG-2023]
MNHKFFLFLFLVVLIGCNNKKEISFETLTISTEKEINKPLVVVNVPKAIKETKVAAAINKVIKDKIISLLIFDDEVVVDNIDDAISSLNEEFLSVKEKLPGDATRWEVTIDGEVAYETDKIITIDLETYEFTGGAHGYESSILLNFDAVKGELIPNEELFASKEAFYNLAEATFRAQEKIPADVPINDTGFMFEEEVFTLPDNIGYTKTGLRLLYNTYEVGSYADGQIEVLLPYAEVNKMLAIKGKEKE